MIHILPREVARFRGRAFLEVGGAGATLLLEVVVPSLVTAVPDAATGCSLSSAFKPLPVFFDPHTPNSNRGPLPRAGGSHPRAKRTGAEQAECQK